jgi:hypothetical protein
MFKAVAIVIPLAISLAANATVSDLPRVSSDITIDGVLDETAWENSLRVELKYETDPGENLPTPVETVAYIAEDGHNLYVAFEANDPDPEQIRAWLRDRDSIGAGDFVGISFDTYGDGRRAFEFFVNPLGVQMDRTFDDVNKRNDRSWNAIWDSAGRIVEDGYIVEMRIPLNQIRFQDIDGQQVWGYRLIRKYPRTRDVSISNMAKDRDLNCKLCQYPRFAGLQGSKPGNNLEVVPTITALQTSTSDEPGVSPIQKQDASANAGVTIRYGLTPELTANLALNPDFSQIESDGIQVSVNNRFALSFPERRPFFLEGADYFTTPMQAVYTRTVSDPDLAAKLTGKRNQNTIATFVAQDSATTLLFPSATGSTRHTMEQSNTAFVGRYSRSLRNVSSLGALLTVRDGDGYHNIVAGVDGRWRINDSNEFVAQLLQSETGYPTEIAAEFEQPSDKFRGRAISLTHTFETSDWFAKLEYEAVDDTFRADAGLVNRAGIDEREYSFGRNWRADNSWWTKLQLRGAYETRERQDGQFLEDNYIAQFTFNGVLESMLDVNYRTGTEFESGQMFDLQRVNISTRVRPVGSLVVGFSSQFGDQIDYDNTRLGDQRRVHPYFSWNVNRNLLLNLNGGRVELDTKDGASIFDATLLDARLVWQFSVRSNIRLTLQQSDITRNPDEYDDVVDAGEKNVGRQLMYSWKMNAQTVFFLGYSDEFVEFDELDRLVAADKSWFMKVGYAWAL